MTWFYLWTSAIHIQLMNPYLVITNDKQYYTQPMKKNIMKYLVSKGHFSSLSGDLYPVKDNKDCTLALYSNNN